MAEEPSDALAIRNFINHNNPNPASATELMQLLKACTSEERKQFGDEARKLLAS